MRSFFWIFFCVYKAAASDHSLVFVHLGNALPSYEEEVLSQARLWNPECPIYLVANEVALLHFHMEGVTAVSSESLNLSPAHIEYLQNHPTFDFWKVTTERLFYVEELMSQYSLKSVFHLENDVMLYRDLREILDIFQRHYAHRLAVTFDNDTRGIAGMMYIDEKEPLSHFLQFILRQKNNDHDMALLGKFRSVSLKQWIDHLPILPPSYEPVQTYQGVGVKNPCDYSNHFQEFQCLFDAAALGQYLGGQDPFHKDMKSGFINESCVFNPAVFSYIWKTDSCGRLAPWIEYQGQKIPICNLHIHSKNLAAFSSKNPHESLEAHPFLEKKIFPLSLEPPEPLDVVILSLEKQNVFLLDEVIEGIQKNLSPQRIVVIAEQPLTAKAEWCGIEKFPFSFTAILEEIYTDFYERRRNRYTLSKHIQHVFSQLAALYAPLVVENLSSNVLVVEPNVFFLKKISFFNEKAEPFFHQEKAPCFDHQYVAVRLFPTLFFQNYTEISHFILMQRPIVKDLHLQSQKIHKEELWKAICHRLNKQVPRLSSFSLYGSFALACTSAPHLHKLESTSVLHTHPLSCQSTYDFVFRP